jgi:hypothetical protein
MNIKPNMTKGTPLSGNSPKSNSYQDADPVETCTCKPLPYGSAPIQGKSDTGTFGGSYNKGPQNGA